MQTIIIDIETAALADAAAFLEEPEPPKNYTKADTIVAWLATAKAEQLARCALDPDLCQVVAIGWKQNGASAAIATDGKTEAELLEAFAELVRPVMGEALPRLLGFNLLGFDLPVLMRRCQYLGIKLPEISLDRYRSPHIDVMEKLSFNGRMRAHSLSFYCKRFGISHDDTTKGADVPALVAAGDWEKIRAHVLDDVCSTHKLAQRLGFV